VLKEGRELDYIINQLPGQIILIILAISGVIGVLDFAGFVPSSLRKMLGKNRARDTIEILAELGIKVDEVKRRELASQIRLSHDLPETSKKAAEMANKFYKKGAFRVGSVDIVDSPGFIDLMGASTARENAELIARLLVSHWRREVEKQGGAINPQIDFVVTPKSGSPLIGYEVSKILQVPLCLYNSEAKFSAEEESFEERFDSEKKPAEGSVGLIVDDSTTGGAKMLALIAEMRKHKLKTTDALVLFEPTIKDPRSKLERTGVKLHSVLKLSKDGGLH
jgi:orotate phosphoribosyltransferase